MYSELKVKTSKSEYKVFLQEGFHPNTNPVNRIHKHSYAEMHLIYGGEAVFNVGNRFITAKSGDLLLIPRQISHCVAETSDTAKHTAFQINCDVSELMIRSVANELAHAFFNEICTTENRLDFAAISAYVALLLSKFSIEEPTFAMNITDYGFLIHEFFSQKYGDNVKLTDLSRILHLSSRQTERLVMQYTSHTFGEELTRTRMAVATHLMNNSSLSLTEIAEYVGYRSYAGFWKAFKKHNENTEHLT